jgi:hypothetical protein
MRYMRFRHRRTCFTSLAQINQALGECVERIVEQGVPSFIYSPADESTPLLFSLSRPLDALEGMLLQKFAGRELPMVEIYKIHNVDTRYIKRNYKDALGRLETAGQASAR